MDLVLGCSFGFVGFPFGIGLSDRFVFIFGLSFQLRDKSQMHPLSLGIWGRGGPGQDCTYLLLSGDIVRWLQPGFVKYNVNLVDGSTISTWCHRKLHRATFVR